MESATRSRGPSGNSLSDSTSHGGKTTKIAPGAFNRHSRRMWLQVQVELVITTCAQLPAKP